MNHLLLPSSLTDAQQANFGFVQAQTSHIEAQLNEIEYQDILYDALIPVDTSAHPFAKQITFYSIDAVGRAEFVNGNANDIPFVDASMNEHSHNIRTAAIGYHVGWEEAGQARMLGFNLDVTKADMARRSAEELCDRVALDGDSAAGMLGLFNYTGIDLVTFTTGGGGASTFGGGTTMTPDEIVERIFLLLSGVTTDSKQTIQADTLLMPLTTLLYLSQTRMPDGVTDTILAWIKKHNPYTMATGQPLDIRGLTQLETAGTGGIKRMVAYARRPDVLKFHQPMPHQFLPAHPMILNIAVPGVQRLGGLEIRKPLGVRYAEGF
jgi:hypothetical protein